MLPRLDIEKFCRTYHLESAGVGQHHHAHEGWVQLHCPFCASGTHGFHLGFSLQRGNFNCWRCGGHSPWKVVAAFLKTNRSDLIGRAFTQCAATGQGLQRQLEARRKQTLARPPLAGSLRKEHRAYLRGRGFKASTLAEEWDLLATRHLSGLWSWRIVAPICDGNGRTVAYVGRSIKKTAKPKYKVTDNADCLIDPKSLIYGIHRAHKEAVVVVEGPADVWRLGAGSVALLGIDWKRQQADILRHFKRRYILFDSVNKQEPTLTDKNAQRRARKLAEYLSLFSGTTEIVDGFDTDPGDMTDRQAQKVMRTLLGSKSWTR